MPRVDGGARIGPAGDGTTARPGRRRRAKETDVVAEEARSQRNRRPRTPVRAMDLGVLAAGAVMIISLFLPLLSFHDLTGERLVGEPFACSTWTPCLAARPPQAQVVLGVVVIAGTALIILLTLARLIWSAADTPTGTAVEFLVALALAAVVAGFVVNQGLGTSWFTWHESNYEIHTRPSWGMVPLGSGVVFVLVRASRRLRARR